MSESMAPGPADHVAGKQMLLRALGPVAAIFIVVGNVIGSGIFAKPGTIAVNAGDFRLIMAVWVAGGVLCLLGALCFAELAVMFPQAGGLYVYLREAYGRLVGFLFGWNEFLFNRPASIGALSTIFVSSLVRSLGWAPGTFERVVIAVIVILAVAWVNIIGVVWGGRLQSLTTIIKIAFVLFIALIPFIGLAMGQSGFSTANYSTTVPISEDVSFLSRIGVVLLAVMWAYNGWHGITPVAEEVRNPSRNIPLALFAGIGILIALYLGANLAYHGVLSMGEVSTAVGKVTAAELMANKLLGPSGAAVISCAIMCSTFGAISSNLLISPRVVFAMGRDGVFFSQIGWVHANYRTPAAAIAVQSLMAILLIVASGLLVAFVPAFAAKNIFDMLTDFVIFAASVFYTLAVFAVIVLRKKMPDVQRPYRTLGYPYVPLLYVACYVWFLWMVFSERRYESGTGLILIATGIPVFYAYRAWSRRHPAHEV